MTLSEGSVIYAECKTRAGHQEAGGPQERISVGRVNGAPTSGVGQASTRVLELRQWVSTVLPVLLLTSYITLGKARALSSLTFFTCKMGVG